MALYLKYRPQDFSSLVWQEFIKATLKAAVEQDKTVGAYIFTWPRGTGKTSTARIFAKAINCEASKSGDPCWKCSICAAFSENSLIDIVEIDAASHTWVDNIREIIEKAQFRPTNAKYKVYIIDEVHMLSKWAFNALLKILEEPPEHIKFILATTEIHKVPETILSRCQRYDFRNFSDEDVKSRLEYIADSEWVSVDDESYEYIVKNAEWGMRNAVSLFEQLISDNTISYTHIVETLWIASEDEKKNFINKLVSRDLSLLEDFESLRSSWKNLKNFFKDILWEIQTSTIAALQNGQDISWSIILLDTISDILQKSKNSFDEATTFRIGILKILSNFSHASLTQSQTLFQPLPLQGKGADNHQIQEKAIEKKEEKNLGEANIVDEAADIFAWSSGLEDLWASKRGESSGFDSDALIATAKTKWAKAALIMSLKGSSFNLDGSTLSISTKTKISFNTISKPENKEYILLAGEELHLGFSELLIS